MCNRPFDRYFTHSFARMAYLPHEQCFSFISPLQKTKTTVWKRPACMDQPDPVVASPSHVAAAPAAVAAVVAPAAASPVPAAAASNWAEAKDPKTGRSYWYNKVRYNNSSYISSPYPPSR